MCAMLANDVLASRGNCLHKLCCRYLVNVLGCFILQSLCSGHVLWSGSRRMRLMLSRKLLRYISVELYGVRSWDMVFYFCCIFVRELQCWYLVVCAYCDVSEHMYILQCWSLDGCPRIHVCIFLYHYLYWWFVVGNRCCPLYQLCCWHFLGRDRCYLGCNMFTLRTWKLLFEWFLHMHPM